MVEHPQMLGLAGVDVLDRRVVAERDDLDPLQPHDAVGLGPAPVVADAHADDAAEGPAHGEAEIADLEIALLEMLEAAPRLVLGMAGKVDLAVLADDARALVDEDRGVEMPALRRQLGIADGKADAERLGRLEERARLRPRHLALEEGVDLGRALQPPAREEGGKGKLGIDDEI